MVDHFSGREELTAWIDDLESYFTANNVADDERYRFVLQRLVEPVRACVMNLTSPLEKISGKTWEWDWMKLKIALREIEAQIKRGGSSTEDRISKVVRVASVGVLATVAGPALLTTGLGAIGFSASGIASGSIAAGIQSMFYGGIIEAGSLLSFCQALAMGGAGATAMAAIISGAGTAAAATIIEIINKTPSKSWDDGPEFRPSLKVIQELLKFK